MVEGAIRDAKQAFFSLYVKRYNFRTECRKYLFVVRQKI